MLLPGIEPGTFGWLDHTRLTLTTTELQQQNNATSAKLIHVWLFLSEHAAPPLLLICNIRFHFEAPGTLATL